MILHALDQLYHRLENDTRYQLPSRGYSRQKVTFKVVLTADGQLLEIQDARTLSDGRSRPRLELVPGTNKPSGIGLNPCFLWDNTKYMLGIDVQKDAERRDAGRALRAFEAFRAKHLSLASQIDSPAFLTVCRFLESWDPNQAEAHDVLAEAGATGFGVFQIQGQEFVHRDPQVMKWWDQSVEETVEARGQCLVTGEMATIARVHPKIRGVIGAQGSGGSIVSFNDDAYESYGKEQSYNAPVSEAAAFRYVAALNALLDGPRSIKHRIRIGDSTVAFWTEHPTATEDIFAAFAAQGDESIALTSSQDESTRAKLELFLRALREGREAYGSLEEEPDRSRFFLLSLAPNQARLSVRFFHCGTLAELLDSLRRHHRDIALAPRWPSDREFPPVWQLLRQTAREPKDIPPVLAGPLLQAVVTGRPYPPTLYAAVLRRVVAERNVDYLKGSVIKGYLNRNEDQEVTMGLDTERVDPAYRLGRLFATLEKTQEDAHDGQLEKTIRHTFYGSASATPGAVFPRLLRTYQHHLAKLEGGRRVTREKLVQEIFSPLDGLPPHLSLAGQGLFAIGYYHQRQNFFERKRAQAPTRVDQEVTS